MQTRSGLSCVTQLNLGPVAAWWLDPDSMCVLQAGIHDVREQAEAVATIGHMLEQLGELLDSFSGF